MPVERAKFDDMEKLVEYSEPRWITSSIADFCYIVEILDRYSEKTGDNFTFADGMTAEQFAWAVIKSELLYPKRLVFKSENLYFSCMEESLRLGEKMMGNGMELLEKKRTKQKKPKKLRGRGDAFD